MTMKKFIALTSAALAAVSLTASAQVTVDLVSAYVFRGKTVNDDVNLQPGFEVMDKSENVTIGTWSNYNTDSSQFDEIDYYLGWTIPTGESPVGIDIGYTEYTYPTSTAEADREPYVDFYGTAAGVDMNILLAYGVDGGIEDSLYVEFGAASEWDVAENVGLGLSAALGYVDPDVGESGFSHLTLGATADVGIPESDYGFYVGLYYIVETDDEVLEVDEDFYFLIGTTL